MTSLQDRLIADGQAPEAFYRCERCGARVPPFAIEVAEDQSYICTGCILDARRVAIVAAEAEDLSIARAARIEQLKAERDALQDGGCMTPLGRMDSNSRSREFLNGAVAAAQVALAAGEAWSIAWTMEDNSIVVHDAAQIVAAGLAVAAHVVAMHAIYTGLRGAVEAAETVAAVEAVVWPAEQGDIDDA